MLYPPLSLRVVCEKSRDYLSHLKTINIKRVEGCNGYGWMYMYNFQFSLPFVLFE